MNIFAPLELKHPIFLLTFCFYSQLILLQVFGQVDSNTKNLRNLLFEENFESDKQWIGVGEQFPESHSFSVVEEPVFRGKYSGKFELRYGDKKVTSTGIRSEVSIEHIGHWEKWYSFAVYFPKEDWGFDKDQEIISQWHESSYPNICFIIHYGLFQFRIGNDHTAWNRYNLGPLIKDEWMEFVIHIVHSKKEDGLVEIWKNGEKIVSHRGANMYSNANTLPKWKLGLYKWTWDKVPTMVDKRVIYFDNIKVGDHHSTLNEMISPTGPLRPILASPIHKNQETNLSPILKWLKRDANVNYRIQVSESNNFEDNLINFDNNGECEFRIEGLKADSKYFWRVKSIIDSGESDWSEIWSFSTISNKFNKSLIGFWKMEEGRGNLIYDHSGEGNDIYFEFPSKKSPYWRDGKIGLALGLNPNTNNIGFLNNNLSLKFDTSITISAWVKPEQAGNRVILSKGNSDGFILGLNDDGKYFFSLKTINGNNPIKLVTKKSYIENEKSWIHLAVTFDGSRLVIFVNGIEENSKYYSFSRIQNNDKDLQIGALEGNNRWVGGIDELKLYNRALSFEEVMNLLLISK